MKKNELFSSYTGIIIIINIAVYILYFILQLVFKNHDILSWIALIPSKILTRPWTLLTSMFMHSPKSLGHIIVNMISLSFIGSFVEKLIGKKRFLRLYLGGGLFAGLFFIAISYLTNTSLNIYAVGASGAIFALGGLLAVLTPKLPVMVFFILPLPMWAAMAFLIFGMWIISTSFGLPIGNVAHLGGLLLGVGYGFYLRKKYPKKSQMISRYFRR